MNKILTFFIFFCFLNADSNISINQDNNISIIEKVLTSKKEKSIRKNTSKDINNSFRITTSRKMKSYLYDNNDSNIYVDIDNILNSNNNDEVLKRQKNLDIDLNPTFNIDSKNIDIQNKTINWQNLFHDDVGINLQIDKKF